VRNLLITAILAALCLIAGCATMSAVGGVAEGIGHDIRRAADSYDQSR